MVNRIQKVRNFINKVRDDIVGFTVNGRAISVTGKRWLYCFDFGNDTVTLTENKDTVEARAVGISQEPKIFVINNAGI